MKGAIVRLSRLLLVPALTWPCAPAQAAELPWTGKSYQIVASDKSLADLLRELAASQGTTAVIDPKVAGTLSGRFGGSPLKTLDSLCATYGLSWYFDGAFLYVDPSSDARSEVLSIGKAAGNAGWLVQSLTQLRIYDPRFPLLVSGRDGTARVTGPRRYVEMVRQVARLLDARNTPEDGAEIRLFPLKYAWAGDFRLTRAGKDVAVPGVAATLRRLYASGAPAAAAGAASSGARAATAFQAGAERQMKLSSGDVVNAPLVRLPGQGVDGAPEESPPEPPAMPADPRQLPQFEADPRLNAVLVRDLPAHMARHESLIASMDVRPRLVEIEVTIMDIGTDTLDSLGVDWRAHNGHVDLQTGDGSRPPLAWGAAPEDGRGATPVGGIFTAAIGSGLREYLLARVSALAQKGDADLVARPKVLTLDNNEAVLENLSDIYVRVSGFQDASLFKVTTGTAVRVTPLIVDEKNGRGVMMTIDIQDGDFDQQAAVDQIPVVNHRTVDTQALIDEGSSLLLAGYSAQSKSDATSGVPVLSGIPVVGNLFKYRQKKTRRQERFYLLTPRLVTTGMSAGAASLVPLPTQDAPLPPAGPASGGAP